MRNQLPPGIKKVELGGRENGRPKVRYDVLVPTGVVNGRRTHIRKRCKTEADARKFQADTLSEVKRGTYVHKSKLTVAEACESWLEGRHNVKRSTLRGYRIELAPVIEALGDIELQKLTKGEVDELVKRLRSGADAKRGKWAARSINGLLTRFGAVVRDRMKQGDVVRNVVELVDRLPADQVEMSVLTIEEMFQVLDYADRDRHLWWLALAMGLRRGEIAGLKRKYVNLDEQTLEIAETRITAGSEIIVGTPKSARSKRVLPIPDELVPILREAFGRVESEYVAANKYGDAYHPNYVTERWEQMLRALGIPKRRLHDARHTYGSYLHWKGYPIADISKSMGHATAAFTMKQYIHSQEDGLKALTGAFKR